MSRPICLPVLLMLLISLAGGCQRSEKQVTTKEEPAKVAHHVDESQLNTITLTDRAEQRLGIEIVAVRLEAKRQRRVVGGEVGLPAGQSIIVSAPIAGTLWPPEGGGSPLPGVELAAGQPVFRFEPLLSPERDVLTPSEQIRVAQTKVDLATAQIEAERQVESTKVAVEVAQIACDRAQQLLKIKAGSQRSVDEAEANLKLATEAYRTAETRHRFLSEITLDQQAGELSSRQLVSPVSGVLQALQVAAGEIVSAGQPLFTVIKTDRMWIRVPIYVGRRRDVDTQQPAIVSEYGAHSTTTPWTAKYVSAPPTADAMAITLDLYYELPNPEGHLYPGQRVAVSVPLHGRAESLVVPFRSVLYDIHGGAWVYERIEPHVYARRRVAVDYVDELDAVLAKGPPAGAEIVTDGAVELFGTEFGVGH